MLRLNSFLRVKLIALPFFCLLRTYYIYLSMKIQQIEIKKLIQAEYNPRKLSTKQYEDLKSSLLRFGVVDPVIVNKNPERENIIIGGHQRTKVWSDLGNEKIPVYYVDLDIEKEKELNIRLNKNSGEFDFELLDEFFSQDDLIEFGFDEMDFFQSDDVDLDEFFEESEEEKEVKNKIILEYTEEDYERVIEAFSNLSGTKEEIVFNLLGL